jgi:predicted nucleic acid-binding protein
VRVVVCDTGPILHLREAQAPHLLERAGEIIVPRAVDQELEIRIATWALKRPAWIHVRSLPETAASHFEQWRGIAGLGAGEAEAIILARSLPADWLLTDDAGARAVASLLGLEVHGSLGLVPWAAASGYLDHAEAHAALERLVRSSLWISPTIMTEARRALEQLFQ